MQTNPASLPMSKRIELEHNPTETLPIGKLVRYQCPGCDRRMELPKDRFESGFRLICMFGDCNWLQTYEPNSGDLTITIISEKD